MPIAAADLQQAKSGPAAADLIQKIVKLPFDSLFKRLVRRQKFAISKIPDPDRLGGVYERVTKLHKLCRWDTTIRLRKDITTANLYSRAAGPDTRAALDYRHDNSPVGRFFRRSNPSATLLRPEHVFS